jgi:hypothetical protein
MFNEENGTITFTGVKEDISEAKLAVFEVKKNYNSWKMTTQFYFFSSNFPGFPPFLLKLHHKNSLRYQTFQQILSSYCHRHELLLAHQICA